MLAIKPDTRYREIPWQKESNTQRFEKESIKIVKESKRSFFLHYVFRLNVFILSSSILIFSLLLHNFNLSPPPPHSWISSSSTIFIFSLLNLDFPLPPQFYYSPSSSSFILLFFHPQIHRPHIDPTSTLDYFSMVKLLFSLHHHISIVFPPPPPPPPPYLISIWVWHFRPDFGFCGLFEGKQ